MRKLILTLAITLSSLLALNAQEVGQMWVGGSIGFWSSKVKGMDESTTTYKFVPEIGYAVNENVGIGINLGYVHDEQMDAEYYPSYDEWDYYKTETNGFTVSPFVRLSFLKGDFGGLFVDILAAYTYAKQKGYDDKVNQIDAGFRPGVAFNISNHISLIGKFGFLGYQYNKTGEIKTNSFGFDFDMSQMMVGACLKF